jgi:hypothetical protein
MIIDPIACSERPRLCQRGTVTLTLLPGRGADLPWAGRSLRFGMTLDEVRDRVEPYAELHDTFVCGAGWAKEFALDGIRVCLFADETDALAGVSASRTPDREASHTPVGLDDIDLFGWPVDEIVDALRDTGRNVRATRTGAWVDGDLHLDWARPPAPAFVGHLCLYAPSGRAGAA